MSSDASHKERRSLPDGYILEPSGRSDIKQSACRPGIEYREVGGRVFIPEANAIAACWAHADSQRAIGRAQGEIGWRRMERERIIEKLRTKARQLGVMRSLEMTYSSHALNVFADDLAAEDMVMTPGSHTKDEEDSE